MIGLNEPETIEDAFVIFQEAADKLAGMEITQRITTLREDRQPLDLHGKKE